MSNKLCFCINNEEVVALQLIQSTLVPTSANMRPPYLLTTGAKNPGTLEGQRFLSRDSLHFQAPGQVVGIYVRVYVGMYVDNLFHDAISGKGSHSP